MFDDSLFVIILLLLSPLLTTKFYPAGTKERAGEDYPGARDLEGLKSFVLAKPVTAASTESKDEL